MILPQQIYRSIVYISLKHNQILIYYPSESLKTVEEESLMMRDVCYLECAEDAGFTQASVTRQVAKTASKNVQMP